MKISPLVKTFSVLSCLMVMTGCASITRGTNDALVVNSNPSQAIVKVYRTNGALTKKEIKNNTIENENDPSAGPIVGKTPASFKLARKGEYKVEISKQGYKTVEVVVGNRVSGAGGAGMAGNLLFGGLIGVGVDASTGAMKDLTPNPVEVTLEPGSGLSVPETVTETSKEMTQLEEAGEVKEKVETN